MDVWADSSSGRSSSGVASCAIGGCDSGNLKFSLVVGSEKRESGSNGSVPFNFFLREIALGLETGRRTREGYEVFGVNIARLVGTEPTLVRMGILEVLNRLPTSKGPFIRPIQSTTQCGK